MKTLHEVLRSGGRGGGEAGEVTATNGKDRRRLRMTPARGEREGPGQVFSRLFAEAVRQGALFQDHFGALPDAAYSVTFFCAFSDNFFSHLFTFGDCPGRFF